MTLVWQPKINKLWADIEKEEGEVEELEQPEEGWWSRIMRRTPWAMLGVEGYKGTLRAEEVKRELRAGEPEPEGLWERFRQGLEPAFAPPPEEKGIELLRQPLRELPGQVVERIPTVPTPEEFREFEELPWWKQLAYESPFWLATIAAPAAIAIKASLATKYPVAVRPFWVKAALQAIRPGVKIEAVQAKIIQAVASKISATRVSLAFHRTPEYKALIEGMPGVTASRKSLEQRLRSAFLYDLQKHPQTAANIRAEIYRAMPNIDPGFTAPVEKGMELMLWVGGGEALLPMNPAKWVMLNILQKMNLVKSLGLSSKIASIAWEALSGADRAILGAEPIVSAAAPSLELPQPRRAVELMRGIVEGWEALNLPARVELFKKLDISGELVPLDWDSLPIATKAKLADSLSPPPPTAPTDAIVPITRSETIPPASPNLTKEQAVENIKMAVYNAIPESELDVAATSFLHENNFDDYIANMPLYKKLTPEEAQKMGIALRKTPKGKEVPAMRRTGFYVNKEFVDYPYFKDVGQVSGHWMDTTSMFSAVDGGYQGGAAAKYILHPTRQTHMAALEWNELEKIKLYNEVFEANKLIGNKWQIRAVSYVSEHVTQAEAASGLVSELLLKPEIAKIVERYPIAVRKRILRAAMETRKAFDRLITMQNQARAKRNQETIPYRENYIPWVMDTNVWSRTFGLRKKPETVMNSPILPDFIKPDKPFNPREQARQGGMTKYHKERNMMTLLFDYVDTAMKDIFYSNIVQNVKVHTQAMRGLGDKSSASLIEDWAAESYAGVTSGVSRGIRRIVPMGALRPLFLLRRLLNTAVFPFNWLWNLSIQTSSTALTVARYGIKNTMLGMEYLINPKVKDQVRKNAYSWIVKSRRGGKMIYQDLGASLEKSSKVETSRIQKAEQVAMYLTSAIEEKLTGLSVWAAYKDGLSRGMREGSRELWEYASDGGALTQSMYNREDLPGVLRAKEVGAFVPFQTFSIQVFNLARELLGAPGIPRAGAYKGIAAKEPTPGAEPLYSKRIKKLLQWMAAIVAINMTVDKVSNRKPWVVGSFIPMWSILMGGTNAGNPWNQPLPTRYAGEFWGGITAVLKYDNYDKIRNWAIKYHAPGGAQIKKTLEGIEAVAEGKKEDVSGRTMFRISKDPLNVAKAYSMGVYGTDEGRAYINKQEKAMGGLPYELTGIPMTFLVKKRRYKVPPTTERELPIEPDASGVDTLRQELGSIEDVRELLRQELGQ